MFEVRYLTVLTFTSLCKSGHGHASSEKITLEGSRAIKEELEIHQLQTNI